MAMDHSNCDHPRTPAGRAACRKARAGGAQPAAKTPTVRVRPTEHADGCIYAGDPHNGRCIVKTTTTPRASTKDLKRPGTKIKGTPDMADVPRAFVVALTSARELGWTTRVGEVYNEAERRIEIFGTHGVITLVWSASNPDGLQAFSFRPNNSSVSARTVSVSAAFILAKDGIEAA